MCTHTPVVGLSPEFAPTTVKASVTQKASARNYFYTGEEDCDKNMENFLSCLRIAADCSSGRAAFVAIKVTALGRPIFLVSFMLHMVASCGLIYDT